MRWRFNRRPPPAPKRKWWRECRCPGRPSSPPPATTWPRSTSWPSPRWRRRRRRPASPSAGRPQVTNLVPGQSQSESSLQQQAPWWRWRRRSPSCTRSRSAPRRSVRRRRGGRGWRRTSLRRTSPWPPCQDMTLTPRRGPSSWTSSDHNRSSGKF